MVLSAEELAIMREEDKRSPEYNMALKPHEAFIQRLELIISKMAQNERKENRTLIKELTATVEVLKEHLAGLAITPGYKVRYKAKGHTDENKEQVIKALDTIFSLGLIEIIVREFFDKRNGYLALSKREKDLDKKDRELAKRERELEKKKRAETTRMGIHTANQFFGNPTQLNLFSEQRIDDFSKATGLQIIKKPDSYGVVLNQSQKRVFEGILKAFSDTNYSGHEQTDLASSSLRDIYPQGKEIVRGIYKNIKSIPVIKLTQADLIRLSGYERTQGDKTDVIQALTFLTTNQFCFFWSRLKHDDKGKPVKEKGEYVKEEVMEVGTLLRVKTIREGGELKYYEIEPSAVLIDQVSKDHGGNYFLVFPTGWRDEIKHLQGKAPSSYTYEFLFWLRVEYEKIRRHNSRRSNKRKFEIKRTWEEIAITLKMPESMYKRNRKRSVKIIEDAYATAKELGYLLRVENNGATDILYLNEKFYPKPGELTSAKSGS